MWAAPVLRPETVWTINGTKFWCCTFVRWSGKVCPVVIARWQLVTNDATGAPTLTDMGASFGIATGGVLTLYIAAPPNSSSVWVRTVDEVSGAVVEQEIEVDLPANTQFPSQRLFMHNGATAAAVVYDCSGVYVETDFCSQSQLSVTKRMSPASSKDTDYRSACHGSRWKALAQTVAVVWVLIFTQNLAGKADNFH